jgi:hypothetical protein
MRRSTPFAALAAILAVSACQDGTVVAPAAPDAPASAARSASAPIYLVTFKDGVDVDAATADLARGNGFAVRSIRHAAARGFSAVVPAARLEALRNDPRVERVEEDGPVQLVFPVQTLARPGGGGTTGQTTPWGITRVGGAGDGTGKTAWILDTGIDLSHPDLNTSRNCHVSFAGTTPEDGNGHGTHVAGTIAAKNNTTDVVGVAANAYVCAVRVLGNSGSGTWEGIVNGVNYVALNGSSGDVANMSLGGSGSNATLEAAVADLAALGVRVVIAAGNEGGERGHHHPGAPERAERLHHLGDRQPRVHALLVQLGEPAGRLRGAGREHHLHAQGRRHHEHERHVDVGAARRGHPPPRLRPRQRQRHLRPRRLPGPDRQPLGAGIRDQGSGSGIRISERSAASLRSPLSGRRAGEGASTYTAGPSPPTPSPALPGRGGALSARSGSRGCGPHRRGLKPPAGTAEAR